MTFKIQIADVCALTTLAHELSESNEGVKIGLEVEALDGAMVLNFWAFDPSSWSDQERSIKNHETRWPWEMCHCESVADYADEMRALVALVKSRIEE